MIDSDRIIEAILAAAAAQAYDLVKSLLAGAEICFLCGAATAEHDRYLTAIRVKTAETELVSGRSYSFRPEVDIIGWLHCGCLYRVRPRGLWFKAVPPAGLAATPWTYPSWNWSHHAAQ